MPVSKESNTQTSQNAFNFCQLHKVQNKCLRKTYKSDTCAQKLIIIQPAALRSVTHCDLMLKDFANSDSWPYQPSLWQKNAWHKGVLDFLLNTAEPGTAFSRGNTADLKVSGTRSESSELKHSWGFHLYGKFLFNVTLIPRCVKSLILLADADCICLTSEVSRLTVLMHFLKDENRNDSFCLTFKHISSLQNTL